MRTDDWTELFCIYNIHNDTAESEHKIHLQKALLTLGKNSVEHFIYTFPGCPTSRYTHLAYIHVCSKPFIIIIITVQPKKTNGDPDAATTGPRARMKHAEPHT